MLEVVSILYIQFFNNLTVGFEIRFSSHMEPNIDDYTTVAPVNGNDIWRLLWNEPDKEDTLKLEELVYGNRNITSRLVIFRHFNVSFFECVLI